MTCTGYRSANCRITSRLWSSGTVRDWRLFLTPPEGGRYHFWRMNVATLLGAWNKPASASVLRAALEKSWWFEQADTSDHKQVWFPYQDELVYALGQLQVFGALTGFSLPTARLHLWLVLLACGVIQARGRYGDLLTAVQINTTLQEEVMRVLAQHFGVSVSEQKECIECLPTCILHGWSGSNANRRRT